MATTADAFEKLKPVPTRVNLRKLYPISLRLIVYRSFWILLALILAIFGLLATGNYTGASAPVESVENSMTQIMAWIFIAILVVSLIKLLYEIVYYLVVTYVIELEQLAIAQGVFLRSRFAIPLVKINDVSLTRDFLEWLLGLHSLAVLTASPLATHGRIQGLSKRNAVHLQTHILAVVDTALPKIKEVGATEAIEHATLRSDGHPNKPSFDHD